MASDQFLSIPSELQEVALAAQKRYDGLGYTIQTEPSDLGFPETPAMICTRDHKSIVVLVDAKIHTGRLANWIGYCKSCTDDWRLVLFLPPNIVVSADEENSLRQEGVGVTVASQKGFTEKVAPKDLALNFSPPKLEDQHTKVRKVLGESYEQFEKHEWRDGYSDACQALEVEAREYLKANIQSNAGPTPVGRIVTVDRKGKDRRHDVRTVGHHVQAHPDAQPQGHSNCGCLAENQF